MSTRIVRRCLTVLAAVAAIATGGCGGKQAAVETASKVPVQTVEIRSQSVTPAVSYAGTVKPWKKVLLGAQIQGRVEKMHVDAGDRVTKGELLVELGGEQLTEARARFAAVERDYERMKALSEQGAVSPQAFEQAEAGYLAAKAGYDLVAGSAQLRAPFNGIVSERYLDEGEVFTLMSMVTSSPAVLEVVKIDTVKVEIAVAERERASVVPGLHATITSTSVRGRAFRGVVSRVDPALDPMSRTASADIVVENPGETLRPGMFADVRLELASREAILVPRDALVRQEGTAVFYVYAVEDGVAKRRELRLGDSFDSSVEVIDGLGEGDVIVTAGRYRLHDGAEVEVVAPGAAEDEGEEEGR